MEPTAVMRLLLILLLLMLLLLRLLLLPLPPQAARGSKPTHTPRPLTLYLRSLRFFS